MSEKDSLRIPMAFSLVDAPRLPLLGEEHPLRREFGKWLSWANAASLALGLLAFATWFVLSQAREEAPVKRQVRLVRYTDLGVPPSISTPSAPQISVAQAVAPPSIGIPEPVPDEMAQSPTIATVGEMSEALAPITMSDLNLGEGEALVVELDVDQRPSPEEFIQVEEDPVRISMDPPVYPEVAMSAEVEGTVIVRALVGKDGKVKDVIIIEGHPLLNDAAIASAKSAIFRPALQRHRPVEVWVMMPITFKMH
jgi:protein TonB